MYIRLPKINIHKPSRGDGFTPRDQMKKNNHEPIIYGQDCTKKQIAGDENEPPRLPKTMNEGE